MKTGKKFFASFFQKRRLFFFEKKNQKTFPRLAGLLAAPAGYGGAPLRRDLAVLALLAFFPRQP